jgi:hypothetical protein
MSTRINVTVGDGGLLDRNAQQTAANRQARVLADQRATAEAEGVERRAADRIAAGLDPLTGLPASTPSSASTINRLDQEPAANRRSAVRFPHVFWVPFFTSDPSLNTGGKQTFVISTETGVRETVEFTYTLPPNAFYTQGSAPEPAEGKALFMSGQSGPRVSRSNYNVISDGGGTWFGARPNNAAPGGEPGDQCRSYWNFPTLTDGDAATTIFPPFTITSCTPTYGQLGLRTDNLSINRNKFTQRVAFALPLSAESLIFVCGVAEAADEGILISSFVQTDGWQGLDQNGGSAFGIVRNRNAYNIGTIPATNRLELKAYIVRKNSITETIIGTGLVETLQSLLSSYTATTVATDVTAAVEIDWRLDITNSGITPFPQYVNPDTGLSIGSRSINTIAQRQAFAATGAFDVAPFFQANLFQYGLANLVGLAKQSFGGLQNASPFPVFFGTGTPQCLFTSPAVFTYINLYKNQQFDIDRFAPSQTTPAGLTLAQARELLVANNVQPPRRFYSLFKEENQEISFAEWTGELPQGAGFPSAGQSFSVYAAGWLKSIEDLGFKPLPRKTVVTRPPDDPEEGLFFSSTGCWDWEKPAYCRARLIELGFFPQPPA